MKNTLAFFLFFLFFLFIVVTAESCKRSNTPKPRGYFRIDFPKKEYIKFNSDCPLSFEYPVYGIIENVDDPDNCWFNVSFPAYRAKIHLTYKNVNNNLAQYADDIHDITYKHIIKADDIEEIPIRNDKTKVYGIIYLITGNTASSISFYATDSTKHFLSGALYFSTIPNSDSLMPCLKFFQQDVVHLTESLNWK